MFMTFNLTNRHCFEKLLPMYQLLNDFSVLTGPTSKMLHTKSQGHQPSGSGEDFKGFLPYMGVSPILVM